MYSIAYVWYANECLALRHFHSQSSDQNFPNISTVILNHLITFTIPIPFHILTVSPAVLKNPLMRTENKWAAIKEWECENKACSAFLHHAPLDLCWNVQDEQALWTVGKHTFTPCVGLFMHVFIDLHVFAQGPCQLYWPFHCPLRS